MNGAEEGAARPATPVLTSVLTCPACGHRAEETMPTDACQFFYECAACHAILKPLPGDCCVFCSYGSVACPPQQLASGRCTCNGETPGPLTP